MKLNATLRNDFTTLIQRLLLIYLLYFICRVLFFVANYGIIGEIEGSEWLTLAYGGWVFDTVSILYTNSLFILLSLLPFRFRERKGYQRTLFWVFTITNSLALFTNLADAVYFHYVHKRFSGDELMYVDNNSNNSDIILKGITENWWLMLALIVLIGVMVLCYRRLIRYRGTSIQNPLRYLLVNFTLLLVGIALTIGGIRGDFGSSRPLTLSNATLFTSSELKAALILSNPFCLLRTLDNEPQPYFTHFEAEELASIYTPYHYPETNPTPKTDSTTAPYLGKRNVVIFILESFSAEHSARLNRDLYPDGVGYTPFLDSLMGEGYTLPNTYASGRKSIDALPSMLTSIPSYINPFVLIPQSIAPTKGLPRMLSEQGYYSAFYNGSPRGSMGFGAYTNLIGMDNYLSQNEYEASRGTNDYDGWWGIWDKPFLQYMASNLATTEQPFLATVFTLTSHHPFKIPKAEKDNFPAGITKMHRPVGYTDAAIRAFMESASEAEWYQNSLFVFVGDHVSSETFAPKTLTHRGGSHIVGFMYTPDGALQGVDSSVFSQADVMPTVLGLLGNEAPYFAYGRDVFQEREARPISIKGVGNQFLAITDSLTVLFDGTQITEAYSASDTLEAHPLPLGGAYQESLTRELQARLQQYYEHIREGNFLLPESNPTTAPEPTLEPTTEP